MRVFDVHRDGCLEDLACELAACKKRASQLGLGRRGLAFLPTLIMTTRNSRKRKRLSSPNVVLESEEIVNEDEGNNEVKEREADVVWSPSRRTTANVSMSFPRNYECVINPPQSSSNCHFLCIEISHSCTSWISKPR